MVSAAGMLNMGMMQGRDVGKLAAFAARLLQGKHRRGAQRGPVLDPVHVCLCTCQFGPETYSTTIDMGSNEDSRQTGLARQFLSSNDVAFKLNVGHPEIRRDDLWRLHMWWMPFGSPLGLWKGGQTKGRPH